MNKYISEYESCEFETWGLARVTVGVCDDTKPAKKEPFTHTNCEKISTLRMWIFDRWSKMVLNPDFELTLSISAAEKF